MTQSHCTGANVPDTNGERSWFCGKWVLVCRMAFRSAAATVRKVAVRNVSYGGKKVGAAAVATNARFGRQNASNLQPSHAASVFTPSAA